MPRSLLSKAELQSERYIVKLSLIKMFAILLQ